VDGVTVSGVPAAGSGAGVPLTAPLPHEFRNIAQQTDISIAAACANGRLVITGIPLSVLKHHSNNIAKVLAAIRILSNCTGKNTIRARRAARQTLGSNSYAAFAAAADKNVAPRKNQRYDDIIPE
jgi:hypothetical protein